MELNPNNISIKACLPMHDVSTQIPAGNEHYSLQEKAVGHLIIRADFSDKKTQKAIKAVIGIESSTKPLESGTNKDYLINWISPDERLLLVPARTEFQVESKLREAISKATSKHYAIVDVTGGQTLLELSGKRAESILKKSMSYDIHPDNFPIGKVVTSNFAKSQVVLRRMGEDSFQLIVRRSFSDYIWKWIVDAGSRE